MESIIFIRHSVFLLAAMLNMFIKVFFCWLLCCFVYLGFFLLVDMLYCLSRYFSVGCYVVFLSSYFSVDCYAKLFIMVFFCWLLCWIVYQSIFLLTAMLYCLSRYFSVSCYAVLFIMVFFYFSVDCYAVLFIKVFFCWPLCCIV